MAYDMKKLPAPGRYNQKGNESPAAFGMGILRSGIGLIKGFADKDLKGQGFKARAGNALKTSANAMLGTDAFETQDMAAAAAGEGGEGNEELATAVTELSEKVDKNTYDISTLGSGAGSGLTYKGSMNGEVKQVISSQTNPLRKTGCVKKYK
jgi:hypothetical protein